MTKQSKQEYFAAMKERYQESLSRKELSRLLDEVVRVCNVHRKHVIRVFNAKAPLARPKAIYGGKKKKLGRPHEYHADAITLFLVGVWHATNKACSKRLQSLLPLWLPKYKEGTGIGLSLEHQALIMRMSHSTIDRLLAVERSKYRLDRGRATTKPGTLLKKRIPIKTSQWDEHRPGFLEVDTVAHCGTSTAGMFVFTLNTVDIATGWVEPRAVWGKGERGVVEAFSDIEQSLPFRLRGFDSDNGSEFLNYHMAAYLTNRKQRPEYTRSRDGKKNDNAHIEGKNWTHVRQYFGYERFDNPDVVPLMNELYAHEYSQLINFFLPSVKLQHKERIGSKIVKHHDKPMTPCDRLLTSPLIPKGVKQQLRERRRTLNPFLLHKIVQTKIRRILRICAQHRQLQSTPQKRHEVTSLALRARPVTSSITSRKNNTTKAAADH